MEAGLSSRVRLEIGDAQDLSEIEDESVDKVRWIGVGVALCDAVLVRVCVCASVCVFVCMRVRVCVFVCARVFMCLRMCEVFCVSVCVF